jgi:hypothetical protein
VSLDTGFSFPSVVSLLLTDIFNPFAGTVMILSLLSFQQGITQKIGLPLASLEGLAYAAFDFQPFYDPMATFVPTSNVLLSLLTRS